MVKYLPTVQETWVWSLGQEDPLEKEMEAHFSTLAWKIPWTEERGGLQRVGHDWTTSLSLFLRMRSWFQWFHLFIYLFNKFSSVFPYLCSDTPFTPYRFQNVVLYPLPIPNVDILYVPITFRWLPLWVPSTCFTTEYSWVEGMAKQRKSWKKRMGGRKVTIILEYFPFFTPTITLFWFQFVIW